MDSAGTIYSLANQSLGVTNNTEQTGGGFCSNLASVIEHLQFSLRQEQERRLELEKEVSSLRKKSADLERLLLEKNDIVVKTTNLQEVQFTTIKQRLLRTLKNVTSNGWLDTGTSAFKKIEFLHQCDQCQYCTRSEVSLILHKMNHCINEQQYYLSTHYFTTRNSNSKSIYECPACDTGTKLTRHEVYRHIYETHTNEKPIVCPFCELSFTHKDYIDEHIREKHAKLPFSTKTPVITSTNNRYQCDSKDVCTNSTINLSTSAVPSDNSSPRTSNSATRGRISSTQSSTSLTGGGGASNKRSSSHTELKCTFLDCNFVTPFPDKLEFHMKAHVNTKYKCPYCPYVSNTIIDIKRHIQKSKKHEGMKMYSCQKCGFGADCDRVFKEHLRVYHFGYEAHDTVIDYFIEEMFSNKNKRTDDEEPTGVGVSITGGATAAAAAIAVNSCVLDSGTPPPAKKHATGSLQASLQLPKSFKLSTMIEEQPQSQSSVSLADAISAQSVSNSYRSVTASSVHHNLSLQTANPINSLAMYHGLELAAAAVEGGSNTSSSGQSFQHAGHAHHHQNLSSHSLNMATGHHHSSGRGGGGATNVNDTLLSENFAHVLNQANQSGTAGGGELPVNLQQYVTYANY